MIFRNASAILLFLKITQTNVYKDSYYDFWEALGKLKIIFYRNCLQFNASAFRYNSSSTTGFRHYRFEAIM